MRARFQSMIFCANKRENSAWGKWLFTNEQQGEFSAVGVLRKSSRVRGLEMELHGEFVNHNKYGRQFQFTRVNSIRPADEESLMLFLQRAHGIGPTRAKEMVNKHGLGVLELIRTDPAKLVEDMGEKYAGKTMEALISLQDDIDEFEAIGPLTALLKGIRFPTSMIEEVLASRVSDPVEIIHENPFWLMRFPGVGFGLCDELRARLHISPDDPRRIDAAITHMATCRMPEIWTRKIQFLYDVAQALRSIPFDTVTELVQRKIDDGELTECETYVGLSREVQWEKRLAEEVKWRLENCQSTWPKAEELSVSPHQRQQLSQSFSNGSLAVLLGCAGTGKTYCAVEVMRRFESIVVCAPTAKAAARIREVLYSAGVSADPSTIHKILQARPTGRGWNYPDVQLNGDLLVLDEGSIADNEHVTRLLAAARHIQNVLIIGDPQQLPPVGSGVPLRDLVSVFGKDRVGILTEVHRNAGAIERVCGQIHRREPFQIPEWTGGTLRWTSSDNMFLMPCQTDNAIKTKIIRFIKSQKEFHKIWDIQLVVPNNDTPLVGRKQMNAVLQAMLNPSESFSWTPFRLGDKVVATANNSEIGTINGMLGRVVNVSSHAVTVKFDDDTECEVPVRGKDARLIELGYALTVHKSQGSQFPVTLVAIPHDNKGSRVMDRGYIYTALSRSEKLTLVFGTQESIQQICRRSVTHERISKVSHWYEEKAPNVTHDSRRHKRAGTVSI